MLDVGGLAVQRVGGGGGGKRSVTFDKREIPADGAATSQARARGFGSDTVEWAPASADYGSKVDKNSGLITAGSNLPDRWKRLTVKAQSTKNAGASARGWITLWEDKLFKAKLDYKDFIKGSPYEVPTVTVGDSGKFGAKYQARSRRMIATMKVKFDFAADKQLPGETSKQRRARERRWAKVRNTFESMVVRAWSKRFQFKNVREPQEIWGKLNPVDVILRIQIDDANPHWTVKIAPVYAGDEFVQGSTAHLGNILKPEVGFSGSKSKEGDLIRLREVIPVVQFDAGKREIPAASVGPLNFLATYLKRIRVPRFTLLIQGSATDVANPDKSRRLANRHAQEVQKALRKAGLTYHVVRTGTKANDTKVTITPSVSNKFVNKYDVTAHEFGHMLGLDDEYSHTSWVKDATGNWMQEKNPFTGKIVNKEVWSEKSTHSELAEKVLEKDYARKVGKIYVPMGSPYDPARPSSPEEFGTSLMASGSDVRIHHYVTFWEALAQVAQTAAVPSSKFGQDDWKFAGG